MTVNNKFKNVYQKIDRDQLTDSQKNEINRINELTKKLIIDRFDHKTARQSTLKTQIGYKVYRHCTKRLCTSSWVIEINIDTMQVIASCYRVCAHLFSEKNKCKTYSMNILIHFTTIINYNQR